METDHENNDVYFSNVVEVLLSRQNCSPFLQLVNQVAIVFFFLSEVESLGLERLAPQAPDVV